jgi:hypothetical protein
MRRSKPKTVRGEVERLKEARRLNSNDPVILELWVRAGGRCEFHGCKDYLLQDKLTTNSAKLADIAHIVARSEGGPRGEDPMPLSQRNGIENLFLACTKHHRLIDNHAMVAKYSKEILIQYKQAHEERIRYVTGLGDENETVIVRMIGNIRGNTTSISNEEIREAVLKSSNRYPRYLGGEHHVEIDLSLIAEADLSRYWQDGVQMIQDVVDRRLTPAIQKNEIRHLSVFAFARIPFLAYLGFAIGDKLPLDIFQKHRKGNEGWVWPTGQREQRFVFRKERDGTDKSCVAVKVSLSGEVLADQLPPEISHDFTVLSLRPEGSKPDRSLLSSKASLDQFRQVYACLLREIEATYPFAQSIHIFPAIPIPAAVILGRELLRDVSPSLLIYDSGPSGFEQAIKINSDRRD